jgi:hypothetical protein
MFVILPRLSNLSAVVSNAGAFSSPTTVLAVYFSRAIGNILFTASAPTVLSYFAIWTPWNCTTYLLSTAPQETWRSGDNFTTNRWQDACLFHVSDNVTHVAGDYNTGANRAALSYEYFRWPGTTSGSYVGRGSISDVSTYCTAFCWHSEDEWQALISISLSSPLSSLPYRQCSGGKTSLDPIILNAEPAKTPRVSRTKSATRSASRRIPTRARTASSIPAATVSQEGAAAGRVRLGLEIGLPVAAVAIVGAGLVIKFGIRRGRNAIMADEDVLALYADDSGPALERQMLRRGSASSARF